MKITLLVLDQMIIAGGARVLAARLKWAGHAVRCVFLRAPTGKELPPEIGEQVARLCEGSAWIGLSLMSNHHPAAVALTRYLRPRSSAPIVWGGVHPTFCPEQSLEHADLVCVGEGDEAVLGLCEALAAGRRPLDVPGIWAKDGDRVVRNGAGRLAGSLDELPLPDFGPDDHFIRDGARVAPMTPALFEKFLTKRETASGAFVAEYYVSTSRGCPFLCSYCASNSIKVLYGGQRFFRLRSVERVVEEVGRLRALYPFIEWIYFADDDLFAAPVERVRAFCDAWRGRVGLPFYATTAPWSYDEAKARLFKEAGMQILNIGIQTVSKAGGRVFRRLVPVKRLEAIVASVHSVGLTLPPVYDFILDNPYEGDADRLENLDFILRMPRPYQLQLFSLIPFPGTEIYARMTQDGLLTDERKMVYEKSYSYPRADYINMLTFLSGRRTPRWLLRFLRSRPMLAVGRSWPVRQLFERVPYGYLVAAARALVNPRFWRFNLAAKGDD